MTENEFILQDRIAKIQSVMRQYGEENFYISFSGGKDSTVLHNLIDMALPDNKIPRVYANTGIEYKKMVEHVEEMQKYDARIEVIKPTVPIKQMLERDGYPFKSKRHSKYVNVYQRNGMTITSTNYLGLNPNSKWSPFKLCPKCLKYQFTPDFNMKISDKCCKNLKEKPLDKWAKDNNKPYAIIALLREEGGRRETANCLAFRGNKFKAFQPLVAITSNWEEWFIKTYNIKLCELYYPPYNFTRTGCKGCPFNVNIGKELKLLKQILPNEAAQCERIWKPVYDEYRRINYRLKKEE